MLGLGAQQVGGPNGENDGPLHRDDSTFGEYMAALDSRSSSGNGFRRLNSSGTFCRLLFADLQPHVAVLHWTSPVGSEDRLGIS